MDPYDDDHSLIANETGSFGFFEAASSEDLDFDAFQTKVLEQNDWRTYTPTEINEYVTVTDNTIRFIPYLPLEDGVEQEKHRWGIISMRFSHLRQYLVTQGFDPRRGVREFIREFWPGTSSLRTLLVLYEDSSEFATWPLAQGDIINSVGHTGSITIDNPFWHTRMTLDMSDYLNPIWVAPIPSLRQYLSTRGFDPSRGVREFIREFWPDIFSSGDSSLRTLLVL